MGDTDLLDRLADAVLARAGSSSARPVRVGLDGVDGAGKTTLAAGLARALARRGSVVDLVHADDHLADAAVRHRRGRRSPVGFFLDSYDDASLRRSALQPRRGVDVVLVEGVFLQRRELDGLLDVVVWLEVPARVSVARCAARDGSDPDPSAASNRRYVVGQRLYRATRSPHRRADVVVVDDGATRRLLQGDAPPAGMQESVVACSTGRRSPASACGLAITGGDETRTHEAQTHESGGAPPGEDGAPPLSGRC